MMFIIPFFIQFVASVIAVVADFFPLFIIARISGYYN